MPRLIQDWFRIWEDRPGIWVIEEPLHSEVVKSYLILGDDLALLIDTGMGVGDIKKAIQDITSLPVAVVLSHAHNDHIGGAWQFDDVSVHPSEADDLAAGQPAERLANWFDASEMSGPLPPGFDRHGFSIPGKESTRFYDDGDCIDLGNRTLEVIHAPGHSRGGLVLLDRADRTLYSTDVIYLRSLYLLNPDSSVSDYVRTLERLAKLSPDLDRLYPSHGPSPINAEFIVPMLEAMREIEAGRVADEVNFDAGIEGGQAATRSRPVLHVHEFGDFRVLVAAH